MRQILMMLVGLFCVVLGINLKKSLADSDTSELAQYLLPLPIVLVGLYLLWQGFRGQLIF